MGKSSKRAPYHHGNLRADLIGAATELLATNGLEQISLRAVARQAGVSHAAPYRHFENKTALLAAIVESGFEKLATAMQKASSGFPEDPAQQLRQAGVAYVQLAVASPALTNLMFGGAYEFDESHVSMRDAADRAFRCFESIIANGVAQQIYKDLPIQQLTLIAWSAVHGLAMLMTASQFKAFPATPKVINDLAGLVSTTLMQGLLRKELIDNDFYRATSPGQADENVESP